MYANEKRPYGAGFDEMPHMADYRDFVNWWNAESWFSLDDDMEIEMEPDFPMAA